MWAPTAHRAFAGAAIRPLAERDEIAEAILTSVRKRGAGKTLCPSEVARRLAPEAWRDLMPDVRAVAADLADQGRVVITQKGERVCVITTRGPIRIGLPGE